MYSRPWRLYAGAVAGVGASRAVWMLRMAKGRGVLVSQVVRRGGVRLAGAVVLVGLAVLFVVLAVRSAFLGAPVETVYGLFMGASFGFYAARLQRARLARWRDARAERRRARGGG